MSEFSNLQSFIQTLKKRLFVKVRLRFVKNFYLLIKCDFISIYNNYLVMYQQLTLKIQLPTVFTENQAATLQILGYTFDPIQRLKGPNGNQSHYTRENVGDVLKIVLEQNKKSLKLYQESDWKSILRPIVPFSFELQLKVKVKNIKEPSISIKPLQTKNRNNLFRVLQLKGINTLNQPQLTLKINELAEQLVVSLEKGFKKSKIQVSLAPRKLYSPHLFIRTQVKEKYVQYYTKGIYQYYHYGDQYFNDHGWGCAYRSLQTLLSWLNLQDHCKLATMLTITEIQEIIDRINIGSQTKLKNTNEWIGATQVSWVVKKITNYDCRILHISDGKDIIEQCEILREHFQKVGCPVMYGGGEYAYSIVGLNYSWQLGECQFLILDPHYTGPDSLDKVLEKKGLAWRKPSEMFKKGIFYNFCLPIIPES